MTQDGDQGGAVSARRRSSRRSRLPKMPMFLNCPPNPPYTNYMDEEPTLKPWKPRKLSNRDKYDYSWITKSSRKKCLTGLRYLTMDELRDQKTGYNLKPRKAKDAEDEAECFATQFVTIPVPKYPPKQTEEDDQGQEADNISSAFFWDQGQGEPPNDLEKGFDKQPADADFAAFAAENASAGSCSSKSAECCEEEEQTQGGNNAVQQFNFEGQGFEGAAAPFKQPFFQGQGQPFAEKNVAQFSNQGPCANQGQPFNVDQFAFQGQNANQGQFSNQGQFAFQGQPFAPNIDKFLSPPGPRTPQGQAGSARPGEFICCMCQQKFLCSKVSDNFGMIQH
ncbi:hypothetical protein LSTR_LSTR012549 [Laodelphax striatellus]|uniref:Uncharacterized protein n=1 Tax=Laodelphax striatellus TaxID=195883 RepID=A0A482XSY0_LAOST|nr:hypothetical protein LSTR_LSTR012549 [Laodelphax striatellus]